MTVVLPREAYSNSFFTMESYLPAVNHFNFLQQEGMERKEIPIGISESFLVAWFMVP